MVKCLVVIRTKVSVHLRVVNHCSGDVHIRVLRVGPRILRVGLGSLATIGSGPATPRGTSIKDVVETPLMNKVPCRQLGSGLRSHRALISMLN